MTKTFLLSLLAGTALAAPTETLRVTVSKSLLETGLGSTLEQTRPVSGKLLDSVLTGTSVTKGKMKLELVPSGDSAGFAVRFDTETEAKAVGTNRPKRGVTVGIRSSSFTPATLTQAFFLRPTGLSSLPATIAAGKSTVYYEGIDVKVDGSLPNLTKISAEQEAWQRAWNLKARGEEQTSRRVENDMRTYLAETLDTSIKSFNHLYQTIFYQPVFGDGSRTFHLSTSAEALTAAVRSEAGSNATPAPEFDGGNAIALRIHDSLATRFFTEGVERKPYDEADLEEFLILHGIPARLGKYSAGAAQFHLKFCSQEPVKVEFQTLQIALTVCSDELEFGGQKGPAKIGLTYVSRINPDGSVDIVRLEEPTLEATHLTGENLAEVQKRLARIFPEDITIPKIQLPGAFGAKGPLVTHRADLDNGWLVSELWFDPAYQQKGGTK